MATTLAKISIKDNSSWNTYLNLIYPVGSVYFAYTSTSPATRFGGTWSAISSKFIYTGGAGTGGNTSHSHTYGIASMDYWNASAAIWLYDGSSKTYKDKSGSVVVSARSYPKNTGFNNDSSYATFSGYGGTAPTTTTNHLPPYQQLYCWRRTA